MITQADLDKATLDVQRWKDAYQKAYKEWSDSGGWFDGRASAKNEMELAEKAIDEALKQLRELTTLFNNQSTQEIKNEFYADQAKDASGSNTIYYLIAVLVVGVLGFILYTKFKK